MEKTREEILSEINAALSEIRERMALVESMLAEYQKADDYDFVVPDQTIVLEDFSDMGSPVAEEVPKEIVEETVTELPALDILPEETFPVESTPVPEAAPVPEPAVVPEPAAVPEPEYRDPLMDIFGNPETDDGTVNSRHRRQKKAVMDVMASREAWRTDMPGSPVRDVKSAISLNDRILFIRELFHEEPLAFQEALAAINGMRSFDEALAYFRKLYPEWNYDSDTAYRFLMAVRRKLN